jgi:glycine betaine/proline transport system ATP-binding protein
MSDSTSAVAEPASSDGQRDPKVKISINGVFKIFGKAPEKARQMVEDGVSKDDVLSQTGNVIGVDNASFTIREGEILVVMGLSGSGKSTLIRCVNRLIEPTFGTIDVDGVDITKLDHDELRVLRRKKFGMVFQSFALLPHKTVGKNVEFGLEIQGVDQKKREEAAERALELVGLKGWGKYFPDNLSGGMKQRVGLARALAVDPDVLLMDEAFSALDPLIRTDMQDELISLQGKMHKTILFITHDLDEALKMGDRIVLMKDGKIEQIGTPEEILSHPASDYVSRFVQNVDYTKVLTAADVMKKPTPVAFVKDGPRVALRKMKESGLSGIFVVKADWELIGHVTADRAVEAAKREEQWLDHITEREECATVAPDMPVRSIFPLVAENNNPVAVIDEENKLKGIIVRGSVLGALSERGDTNDE